MSFTYDPNNTFVDKYYRARATNAFANGPPMKETAFSETFTPGPDAPTAPDQPDAGLPLNNGPDAPTKSFNTADLKKWRENLIRYSRASTPDKVAAIDNYIGDYTYRNFRSRWERAVQVSQSDPELAARLMTEAYQYFPNGQGAVVRYDPKTAKFLSIPYHEASGKAGKPMVFGVDDASMISRQLTPEQFKVGSAEANARVVTQGNRSNIRINEAQEGRNAEMHPLNMEGKGLENTRNRQIIDQSTQSFPLEQKQRELGIKQAALNLEEGTYDFSNKQATDQAWQAANQPRPPGKITGKAADLAQLQPPLANALRSTGMDLQINSGRRPGDKGSQHQHGNAVDIQISHMSDAQKQELVFRLYAAGVTRFITYSDSGHLHADMGEGNGRFWPMHDGTNKNIANAPAWFKDVIAKIQAGDVPYSAGGTPTPTESLRTTAARTPSFASAQEALKTASTMESQQAQTTNYEELAETRRMGNDLFSNYQQELQMIDASDASPEEKAVQREQALTDSLIRATPETVGTARAAAEKATQASLKQSTTKLDKRQERAEEIYQNFLPAFESNEWLDAVAAADSDVARTLQEAAGGRGRKHHPQVAQTMAAAAVEIGLLNEELGNAYAYPNLVTAMAYVMAGMEDKIRLRPTQTGERLVEVTVPGAASVFMHEQQFSALQNAYWETQPTQPPPRRSPPTPRELEEAAQQPTQPLPDWVKEPGPLVLPDVETPRAIPDTAPM